MAGVATEKPGSHLYAYRSLIFATVLLARCQTSNTIYLFSETLRGYREAEVSEGSFKHTWLLNLEFLLT